jgi:hypothetical protein
LSLLRSQIFLPTTIKVENDDHSAHDVQSVETGDRKIDAETNCATAEITSRLMLLLSILIAALAMLGGSRCFTLTLAGSGSTSQSRRSFRRCAQTTRLTGDRGLRSAVDPDGIVLELGLVFEELNYEKCPGKRQRQETPCQTGASSD